VKVGWEARLRSHNLTSGVVRTQRRDATRESVVGRRAKLLNGFLKNASSRPAYNFPSGPAPSNHRRYGDARKFLAGNGSSDGEWFAPKR
jgi:hypothetical protein